MYSVVLMMAMSGGTEAVDFGHRNRCHCSGGYSCSGSYGGCSGYYGGCSGSYGGHGRVVYGCTGTMGWGCTGSMGYGCGGGVIGGPYMGGPVGGPETLKVPPKKTTKPDEESRAPAPATILVTLPANASLTIDGSPTTSTSATGTLVSPPLERGNTYVYTLRAEVNGQAQTQEVQVRAGEVARTQFTFPTAGVAAR